MWSIRPKVGAGASSMVLCVACAATNPRAGGDTDAETDSPAQSCATLPAEGACVDGNVYRCIVPDDSEPYVAIEECDEAEVCELVDDVPTCLVDTECTPGASRCEGDRIDRCDEDGFWSPGQSCDSCVESGLGASCAYTGQTVPYTGVLQYDVRWPNATFSDWDTYTEAVPANGFLVASWQDDKLVEMTTTAVDGTFTVQVPQPATVDDLITVYTATIDFDSDEISMALATPGIAGEEHNHNTFEPSDEASIWSWSWGPSELASGSTVTIAEEHGSGAARMFDYLRYASQLSTQYIPRRGKPLVAWFDYGVTWSCRGCYLPRSTAFAGGVFEGQILFSGSLVDQQWWADSTVAHELGHWVMDSYAASTKENGPRCLTGLVPPGIAWSEGWATGFSAFVRNQPWYLTKLEGTMSWATLDTRQYSTGSFWQRPQASAGLQQLMDENEVSAILWGLYAAGATFEDLFDAMASEALQGPEFGREYTSTSWTMSRCVASNLEETGLASPILADYLDALVCNGVSGAIVDAATEPASHYPYPSSSPRCP
jgi:hypothetical protein